MKLHVPFVATLAALVTFLFVATSCGSTDNDSAAIRDALAGPIANAVTEVIRQGAVTEDVGAELASSVTAQVGPLLQQMSRDAAARGGVVDQGTVDVAFPAILEAVNRAIQERGLTEDNALALGEQLVASLGPTIAASIQDGQTDGSSKGGMIGGAIGLLGTIASWYLRDRRKKTGGDPLQLAGVNTPPTTSA